MIRFIVSILLMTLVVCGALVLEGFNPAVFLGFTSFLIVLGIPLFASLGVWKAPDLINVWRDAFSSSQRQSSKESLAVIGFCERLFYLSGVCGTLLGFAAVLLRYGQLGSVENVCRGLAYSLLCLIYAMLFASVSRILHARIERTLR